LFHPRDWPIKTKLRWILAVSNVLVVVLLGSAMVKHDRSAFRDRLTWELGVINRIAASNCASAVIFEDEEFTLQTLESMGFLPMLNSAVVYRNDGTVFTSWGDSTDSDLAAYHWSGSTDPLLADGRAILSQSIQWEGEKAGTLVLAYNLAEEDLHTNRLLLYFAMLAGLALFISMIVSEHLQRWISGPITKLAKAAKTVTEKETYSVRVQGRSKDEVGQLVSAFNEMLQEVESREQALIQTSRAKSDFLANMSHELRTPLNGIIGMTSLLEETSLGGEQSNLVSYIKTSGDHLMTVINDILDFSKIEAGMMVLERAPFDLHQTVEDIKVISGSLAEEKGLDLTIDFDEKVPVQVKGDVVRVRQILLNLVSNAIKFTAEGGVVVKVTRSGSGNNLERVRFAVTDTGIGIPPDKQAAVFEQFTQADSSTTRSFGGTGLGLAICKQLVELMGGTFGLNSAEGEGSVFWFELNLEADADNITPTPDEVSGEDVFLTEGACAEGCHILLAEDNPINQVFARKLLTILGAEVQVANNGLEALEMVQNEEFDLVLMDCQMPIMDGYQATDQIRQLGGHFGDLPIIALTAFALAEDKEKCLAAGMNDYLTKPVDRQAIVSAIKRWAKPGTRVV